MTFKKNLSFVPQSHLPERWVYMARCELYHSGLSPCASPHLGSPHHLPIPTARPVMAQCREQKLPHVFQSERDLVLELGAYRIIKRLGGAEVPLRLFNSRTQHHRHHDPNVGKLLPPRQLITPRHVGRRPWNNESGPCDCL